MPKLHKRKDENLIGKKRIFTGNAKELTPKQKAFGSIDVKKLVYIPELKMFVENRHNKTKEQIRKERLNNKVVKKVETKEDKVILEKE